MTAFCRRKKILWWDQDLNKGIKWSISGVDCWHELRLILKIIGWQTLILTVALHRYNVALKCMAQCSPWKDQASSIRRRILCRKNRQLKSGLGINQVLNYKRNNLLFVQESNKCRSAASYENKAFNKSRFLRSTVSLKIFLVDFSRFIFHFWLFLYFLLFLLISSERRNVFNSSWEHFGLNQRSSFCFERFMQYL